MPLANITSNLCGAVFSRPLERFVMLFNRSVRPHWSVLLTVGFLHHYLIFEPEHEPVDYCTANKNSARSIIKMRRKVFILTIYASNVGRNEVPSSSREFRVFPLAWKCSDRRFGKISCPAAANITCTDIGTQEVLHGMANRDLHVIARFYCFRCICKSDNQSFCCSCGPISSVRRDPCSQAKVDSNAARIIEFMNPQRQENKLVSPLYFGQVGFAEHLLGRIKYGIIQSVSVQAQYGAKLSGVRRSQTRKKFADDCPHRRFLSPDYVLSHGRAKMARRICFLPVFVKELPRDIDPVIFTLFLPDLIFQSIRNSRRNSRTRIVGQGLGTRGCPPRRCTARIGLDAMLAEARPAKHQHKERQSKSGIYQDDNHNACHGNPPCHNANDDRDSGRYKYQCAQGELLEHTPGAHQPGVVSIVRVAGRSSEAAYHKGRSTYRTSHQPKYNFLCLHVNNVSCNRRRWSRNNPMFIGTSSVGIAHACYVIDLPVVL
jgi:hypothetical protein